MNNHTDVREQLWIASLELNKLAERINKHISLEDGKEFELDIVFSMVDSRRYIEIKLGNDSKISYDMGYLSAHGCALVIEKLRQEIFEINFREQLESELVQEQP